MRLVRIVAAAVSLLFIMNAWFSVSFADASVVNVDSGKEGYTDTLVFTMNFGTPRLEKAEDGYYRVVVDGAENVITTRAGEPVLPSHTEVLELDRYDDVLSVKVTPVVRDSMTIHGTIEPVYPPQIAVAGYQNPSPFLGNVYDSDEAFPSDWCRWHTGVGLNENRTIVKFLPITVYPVRFIGRTNTLLYTTSVRAPWSSGTTMSLPQ